MADLLRDEGCPIPAQRTISSSRGPAPDAARREQVVGALHNLLGQDRTWTSARLAEALRGRGRAVGPLLTRSTRRAKREYPWQITTYVIFEFPFLATLPS